MIKIVAQNYSKADKVDTFISIAKQLVQATKENDAGCIRYELLQDVKDPQLLTILEAWKDQESLNQHMTAKHFQEATAQFKDLTEKPSDIHLYQTLA